MKYLGQLVTRDGIRACSSKIKAIVEMPRPTSATEVQRFIGKCQYYRKFIPNFSQIAPLLVRARTTRRDFAWTDACSLARTRLREALISDANLFTPPHRGLPAGLGRSRGGPGCCPSANTRRGKEGGCLCVTIAVGVR